MSKVLVSESYLTDIAKAIRVKNNSTVKYKPNEMSDAIKTLTLDNSVTIRSNDAWKYAIDSTLEHQFITVKVSGKLTGDSTTGYKGEVIFDPYITNDYGWLAGKITKTVDNTNHVITFSAEAATELSGVLQDGWTPVYIVNNQYYTTTTPDKIDSLKKVSSSDNIENLLICGYYNIDKSTNKLVATEPTTYDSLNPFPSSNTATKKIRDNYMTTISSGFEKRYGINDSLEELYLPNLKSISNSGIYGLAELKVIHIQNIETSCSESISKNGVSSYYLPKLKIVNGSIFRSDSFLIIYLKDVTSLIVEDSCPKITLIIDNVTPPEFKNHFFPDSLTILVPNSAVDTYKNKTASYITIKGDPLSTIIKSMDDYYININQENSQVTVNKKDCYGGYGPYDCILNGKNATLKSFNNSLNALDIDLTEHSVLVRTTNASIDVADWTNAYLNHLTLTRGSDGAGGTILLGHNKTTTFKFTDTSNNKNVTYYCARYDTHSYTQITPGCTLQDLVTSANKGEKLKLTFTS